MQNQTVVPMAPAREFHQQRRLLARDSWHTWGVLPSLNRPPDMPGVGEHEAELASVSGQREPVADFLAGGGHGFSWSGPFLAFKNHGDSSPCPVRLVSIEIGKPLDLHP